MLAFRTIFFTISKWQNWHPFFCPTISPRIDSYFTIMNEKDKMQILIFKSLEPAIVDIFAWKMTKVIQSITKIVAFWLTHRSLN